MGQGRKVSRTYIMLLNILSATRRPKKYIKKESPPETPTKKPGRGRPRKSEIERQEPGPKIRRISSTKVKLVKRIHDPHRFFRSDESSSSTPYFQRPTTNFFNYEWGISKPLEKPKNIPNDNPANLLRCLDKVDHDLDPDEIVNIEIESEKEPEDALTEFPKPWAGKYTEAELPKVMKEIMAVSGFSAEDRIVLY